jgi:hypothetical protein
MDSTREQTELRFRAAQEALEDFVQANVQFTLTDGLSFADMHNSDALARQYADLKAEHDAAGAEWAGSLTQQA